MTNFIMTELEKIETLLNESFSINEDFVNVTAILDFDKEFNLSENNDYSTPVVLIEPEEILSIKNGAKGQMINGEFKVVLLTIVAKINRQFNEYFNEITNIVEYIRVILESIPNVSYQFNGHKFVNNYDIGNYPAIAVLSTYTIRLNNYDFS